MGFILGHLVAGLGAVLFTILLVLWVYYDAEHKGENGLIWALIVLFFSLPGVVAYVLLSGPSDDTRRIDINDENEFVARAKYQKQLSTGGGSNAKIPVRASADPNFSDPYLDRLIDKGKLSDARMYLRDMQKMVREQNDATGMANYSIYESKISAASKQSVRESGL